MSYLRYHDCVAGCGNRITYRFAICANCEGLYGSSMTHWPGWLQEMWKMEQRERRAARRIYENEINFSDVTNLAMIEGDDIPDDYE